MNQVAVLRGTIGRHGPGGVIVLAAVGVIALTAYSLRHAYIGDAAIYLPYARNAADGHLFQFNVGEFSSGSTSPLWAVLLAIPFLLGFGVTGAKAFAAIFAVLAFLATVVAAHRMSRSWTAAAVASLVFLGPAAYFAISLYESGLVLMLTALALIAGERAHRLWREENRVTLRGIGPLVAVWAALPLARPDAVIMVVAQAVALFAFAAASRRQAVPALLAALAAAAVPAAAYFGYSLAELGTASTSSQGRAFALQETAKEFVGPFYRSGDAVREILGSPWVFGLVPAVAGLVLLARRHATRWLALYGVAVLCGYVFLLTFVAPGFFDTPRYLLPVVPVIAVAAAHAIAQVRGAMLGPVALVISIVVIGGSAGLWLRDQVDLIQTFGLTNHEVFERDVVAMIERRATPGDTVLAYEVQLRHYLSEDLRVLSQDGITDGKVHPYQESRDITGFLKRYRPRWWIADENVKFRRYLNGTVLDRVRDQFKRSPRPAARTIDGIRFTLVTRRERPIVRGFGGWEMLFRLDYPDGTQG